MPIKRLPKKLVDSISTNLDTLFDRVKAQALGPGHVQDKRLAIGFDRWLSLPGVYEQAAKEEGSEPDHDLLDSALRTAANYIDATKEKAKARVVNEINAHLRAGTIGNDKPEEFEDKLRDSLQNIWTDVTEQVHRIIDSEASHVKNLGLLDGIQQVNAERGIEDPSVFFVTARENVCDECLRLHTVDGGKPRVWKLSEIGHDYHKRGDPEPKLNGLHPHCFTGSMRLHTNLGLLTARELFDLATPVSAVVDGRVLNRRQGNNQYGDEIPGSVWYHRHRSGARLRAATHVYDTGVQRCIRITLDSGHQLEVSLGHEMWIDDGTVGKKIRADALQIGDKVPLLSGIGAFGTDHFPLEAELMGSILGDGTLGIDTAQFHFFGTDIPYGVSLAEAASQVTGQAYCARVQPPDAKYNVPRMIFNSTVLRRSFVHDFGLSKTPRRVPKRMWSADQETTAAFLRGLYAADGHSEDTPSVVLAQNDLEFLREIQVLLANLGLRSRIYTHGTDEVLKTITYADGRQFDTVRKPAWRLHIGGVDQVRYFAKVIGFGVPAKQTALNARLAQVKGKALHGSWRTAHVLMIEELGEQQTYCLTEPMTNTVTVNGIVTGNCRCTIATLLPGFGFNGAGKVTYVDRDHDEYAAQHGLKKSESSAETKRLVRRWTKEGSVSVRDRLPKMTGEHRTHALESLRRNVRLVEGKKLLLFRGMGSDELEAAMDGDCLVYDTRTSWTPYRKQADGFALEYKGKSVSAWIPESAVVTVPNEYRAAEYTLEHEVVVAPGEYEFREILEPKKLAKNDSSTALSIPYVHRVSSLKTLNFGDSFQQAYEPSGEFMTPLEDRSPDYVVRPDDLERGDINDRSQGKVWFEHGTVHFQNPLRVAHSLEQPWKKTVSTMFGGKTGPKLTAAIIAAGHDGIVAHDAEKGHFVELVNLAGRKDVKHALPPDAHKYGKGGLPKRRAGKLVKAARAPAKAKKPKATNPFDTVFHVGDLDAPRTPPHDSLEGGELSVSHHPEEWKQIARIGGKTTYSLHKPGAKFLEVGSTIVGRPHRKKEWLDWGIKNGYLQHGTWHRVSWKDEEDGTQRYSDYDDPKEAQYEVNDAKESDGNPRTVKVQNGYRFGPKGEDYWRQSFKSTSAVRHEMAEDFAPIFYARDNGYDGVWWHERLDPDNLSAPRGLIFQHSLPSWRRSDVSAPGARVKKSEPPDAPHKVKDQTYGDGTAEYHVGTLVQHAAAHYPVTQVPVTHLQHVINEASTDEPWGSPAFRARAMKADTKYPLLIVQHPEGMHIADGMHRFYRHIENGATHVPAYVIPHDKLPRQALVKSEPPSDDLLRQSLLRHRDAMLNEMRASGHLNPTPEHINCGACEDFQQRVIGDHPDSREMDATDVGLDMHNAPHMWIERGGKHYDAEAVDGVEDWRQLPFFQRNPPPVKKSEEQELSSAWNVDMDAARTMAARFSRDGYRSWDGKVVHAPIAKLKHVGRGVAGSPGNYPAAAEHVAYFGDLIRQGRKLAPVTLFPNDDGTYEVPDGNHRISAAVLNGHKHVPAIVLARTVQKSEEQPGTAGGKLEKMTMRTRPTYSQKWAYRGMDVPAHRAVQALGKIVPRPAHDLDGESVTFFTHDPQGARYYAGENKRRKHPGHVYRFPWPKDAMAHNQGWDEEPSGEWHTRQPIPLEHAQVYVGQPGQESEDDALWRPAKEMKKSEPRPTRQPPTKWHPDEPDDASEAARWHGDNTDRQLTYRREYIPVASIGNDTTENWLQWYEDERREHDELRPGYFDQLEVAYHKTPEHLPLIAVVHGAKKYAESVQSDGNRYGLDDGAHRLAIAHKLGMTHVPAFVGYPKIKKSEEPATLVKNGTGSGGKGPVPPAPMKWHPEEPDDASVAAEKLVNLPRGQYRFRREWVEVGRFTSRHQPLLDYGTRPEHWMAWYEQEKADEPEYYRNVESSFLSAPHNAPVVALEQGANRPLMLEDGNHRVAIAHASGMRFVPAFVGRKLT